MAAGRRSGLSADERGFTLVETLITVWIMGAVFVCGFAALFTMIRTSEAQRRRTLAEVELRHFAEWVRAADYVPCDALTVDSYASSYEPGDSDVRARVTGVQFWQPSPTGDYSQAFGGTVGTCPSGGDTGAEQLSLEISLGGDADVVMSTNVVKRAS